MRKAIQVLLVILLFSCQPSKVARENILMIDHHTHLVSDLTKEQTISFVNQVDVDEAVTKKYTLLSDASDLIQSLDSGGIDKAIVLSNGYFMDHFLENGDSLNIERVRQENNWTAKQCEKYPDRLIPFLGVNPIRSYSPKEITRCYEELNFKGIKLHFTNSRVDLRDSVHVGRVKRVFQLATV